MAKRRAKNKDNVVSEKSQVSRTSRALTEKRGYRKTIRKTVAKSVVYKYLQDTVIDLPYDWEWNEEEHPLPMVPPTTPKTNEFRFEFRFQQLPYIFHDLTTLEVPMVRKQGIKQCIKELGLYFGCNEYKFNFLQFWFLDVLTDCIWRSQDRFEFPPDQQKIILSWILFMFDIIGDSNYNYTQKDVFAIFKESMVAAAEVLEEGHNEILLPLKLIKIRTGHDSDDLEETTPISSKTKTCTLDTISTDITAARTEDSKQTESMDYDSLYEIHLGRDKLQVVLDHEVCQCSEYGESLSAHGHANADEVEFVDASVQEYYVPSESDWMEYEAEESFAPTDIIDDWDYRDFYKPNSRTPSRFLPSTSEEITEISETLQKEANISLTDFGSLSKLTFLRLPSIARPTKSQDKIKDKLNNYLIFRKLSSHTNEEIVEPIESEIIKEPIVETEVLEEELVELDTNIKEEFVNETQEEQIQKIMKGLQKLKLIEQRMRDLSDSKEGLSDWQMKSSTEIIKKESSIKGDTCIPENEIKTILDSHNIEDLGETEILNFSVLWAIIDFVYDYFSDSFQYSLIKAALTVKPNVFIQQINQNYRVPKKLTEDLTSRVPDLKEKHKKIHRKVDKSVADGKKTKDSKEDKKSKKKDAEKDKKDKAKAAKKELPKSPKKESKDIKLTKEELLNLQRLEHEEALRLKRERHRVFMFPLTEAVTDKFFSKKFSNWSKLEIITKKEDKKDEKITDKKKK